MNAASPSSTSRHRHWFRRALAARRLRIVTGIILFTYVTTHFLNHALGLVSLEAMEIGRQVFLAAWRNWVGTFVLYGALLTHFCLALYAIYTRRRLMNMSTSEILQLLLGLTVPFLLAVHVFGTRGLHETQGLNDTYAYELLFLWVNRPDVGLRQVILFLVAWTHGCMGLHFYLRLRPWYRPALPYLYGGALLVPALGLLGFVAGGREVEQLAEDARWIDALKRRIDWPADPDAAQAFVEGGAEIVQIVVLAMILATFLLRGVRAIGERRRGLVRVSYGNGRTVESVPGPTVLELSQQHNIPHASVCGGRGRCSTCRVRVNEGLDSLPPPSPAEAAVLERVGAAPNVRLACQIRPQANIGVMPLLPPHVGPKAAVRRPGYLQGWEREIVILFADLRAFTRFSENKLPYDVVFVLNRYFAAMGTAIETAGGHVDKFIGDGVMALFGIQDGVEAGALQALSAASAMATKLDELNRALATDLDEPLRIGIGLHAGPVIVGEMGYAHATALTAIGDPVNTASRLEALTKEHSAQLILSAKVADYAKVDLSSFAAHNVDIRGRREPLRVYVVGDAAKLPVN